MADRKKAMEAEFTKTFMTQLRRYRLAAGLDQKDVATRLDVSVSAVSRWESGQDVPRGRRFKQLAKVLGVNPLALTQIIDPEPAMAGR